MNFSPSLPRLFISTRRNEPLKLDNPRRQINGNEHTIFAPTANYRGWHSRRDDCDNDSSETRIVAFFDFLFFRQKLDKKYGLNAIIETVFPEFI